MCGIAGILAPGWGAEEIERALVGMRDRLRHRGPDDVGIFVGDGIALGHTRLSIIDLAGGRQPLVNEDRTVHLVANGEIYNYRDLQRDLLQRGHRLRTQSDCEVIVHLYEDYGEECVGRLEGMFAFALWDSRKGHLLLARDRFGIKPLYVALSAERTLFASELTALLASGLLKPEIDPQALYAYMALSYVPGPSSIIRGVDKVQPSERILVGKGLIRRSRYWKPQPGSCPRKRSAAVDELAHRLEHSVESQLVADVPVAAFLSGGGGFIERCGHGPAIHPYGNFLRVFFREWCGRGAHCTRGGRPSWNTPP